MDAGPGGTGGVEPDGVRASPQRGGARRARGEGKRGLRKGPPLAHDTSVSMMGAMNMTGTSMDFGRARSTAAERAFVFAGLAIALLASAVALASDVDMAHLGPLWLGALAWTVMASLGGALRRGLVHRDWSAFRRVPLPDGRDDRIDWVSKTGAYAYLRIGEEHEELARDDDRLD